MKNTSIGFHTLSTFQKMSGEDYGVLGGDFFGYMRKYGDMIRREIKDKKNPMLTVATEYTYKTNKGIRWLMFSKEVGRGFEIHGLLAVITPKVIVNKDYVQAATEDDIEILAAVFNEEAKKISPLISKFGTYSVGRADPCINFDLEELNYPCTSKQMMLLLKQCYIPNSFTAYKEYSDTARKKIVPKNNLYLESNSVTINCYRKKGQIIRFEAQCKYPKLYYLSKDLRHKSKYNISFSELSWEDEVDYMDRDIHNPSIPADIILSHDITSGIVVEYFYKVVRKGDYFTLGGARWMVERYGFRREKEKRLLNTLGLVKKYRGIDKAMSKLKGEELQEFKRSLKDLDAIAVNPVTIPRRWGIKYIPNLMTAYHDSIYEEHFLFGNEARNHAYLTEYLGGEV